MNGVIPIPRPGVKRKSPNGKDRGIDLGQKKKIEKEKDQKIDHVINLRRKGNGKTRGKENGSGKNQETEKFQKKWMIEKMAAREKNLRKGRLQNLMFSKIQHKEFSYQQILKVFETFKRRSRSQAEPNRTETTAVARVDERNGSSKIEEELMGIGNYNIIMLFSKKNLKSTKN